MKRTRQIECSKQNINFQRFLFCLSRLKDRRASHISRNWSYLMMCLLFFFSGVFSSALQAQQQNQFTQFMYSKLMFNPAYAGSKGTTCFTAVYRNQWIGLEGAPQTQRIGMHTPVSAGRIGLGLEVYHHTIGITNEWTIAGSYAYRMKFGKGELSVGLNSSIRYLGVDYTDDRLRATQGTNSDNSIWTTYQSKAMAASLLLVIGAFAVFAMNFSDLNLSGMLATNDRQEPNILIKHECNSVAHANENIYKVVQQQKSFQNDNQNRQISSIDTHVNDISYRLQKIEDSLLDIKSRVDSDNHNTTAKLMAIANVVNSQERKINELAYQPIHSVQSEPVSFDYAYELSSQVEPQSYDYEDIYSPSYVIDSIDSLDHAANSYDEKGPLKQNSFGCLSCMHPNYSVDETGASDNTKNNAILIGQVSGQGAKLLQHKIGMLENYLYSRLQESIRESSMGARIEKFTQLANQESAKLDTAYFQELCVNKDVVLIASYELVVNQWGADGTYLRFHHCKIDKTVVHLEKNLAPTVMNVPKPYLTEDAWRNVDKSVDYMLGKLVVSQNVEHL